MGRTERSAGSGGVQPVERQKEREKEKGRKKTMVLPSFLIGERISPPHRRKRLAEKKRKSNLGQETWDGRRKKIPAQPRGKKGIDQKKKRAFKTLSYVEADFKRWSRGGDIRQGGKRHDWDRPTGKKGGFGGTLPGKRDSSGERRIMRNNLEGGRARCS